MNVASAMTRAPGELATPPVPETGERVGGDPTRRRCLVSGESMAKAGMVRFVVAPPPQAGGRGEIVPDLEERLPGRGLWLTARRDIVAAAVTQRLFARAAQAAVAAAPDLDQRVERLLVRRVIALVGLARRGGAAVSGFDKVRGELALARTGLLLLAQDVGGDGWRKLAGVAGDVAVARVLSAAELGEAFARPDAVYVAIARGRMADLLRREAARLAGFRTPPATVISEDERDLDGR